MGIFAGNAPSAGLKAALTATIAEIAGVDISVVVVRLSLPRRLRSGTAEFSIAYTIIVSANEAVAVVERIASTDLDSATAVVTQHFSNAGINGAVNVVGLSADIAGGDAGDIVKDVLALWIGAGIGGGIGALFLVLCCCCFYRCYTGKGKAVKQTKAPETALPTLMSTEEGASDKHTAVTI